MNLTLTIKLCPTSEQEAVLRSATRVYIRTVNQIVATAVENEAWIPVTSKTVEAPLPSAVINQAIQEAHSLFRKIPKLGKVPILKKPVCFWNNQNYRVGETSISFPVWLEGKCTRIEVKAWIQDRHREQLPGRHLGTLRIVQKSGKWMAQVPLWMEEIAQPAEGETMGVDLGIKVPAVAATSTGKTRFFGNGRHRKYVRRRYSQRRKKLGKAQKLAAIRKSRDKEQRWMRDQDHKLSRAIVNFALQEGVSTIHLEKLTNIRQTTRQSRKNNRSLHTWSFYRLASFLEYKARLVGIKVDYVDPAYTSQACPVCGVCHQARDRVYVCGCGFRSHRDRVGALNILRAPAQAGDRLAA